MPRGSLAEGGAAELADGGRRWSREEISRTMGIPHGGAWTAELLHQGLTAGSAHLLPHPPGTPDGPPPWGAGGFRRVEAALPSEQQLRGWQGSQARAWYLQHSTRGLGSGAWSGAQTEEGPASAPHAGGT